MPNKSSKPSPNGKHEAAVQRAASKPKLLSGGNPQIPKGDGDGPVGADLDAIPGWKGGVGRRLDELLVRTVLTVCKAVGLKRAGFSASLLAPRSNAWWDGQEFVPHPLTLATLLIGDACFVAELLEAERLRDHPDQ